MGVLRELFSGLPVVTREGDPGVLGPLAEVTPEERAAVERAVRKRQHEYWATRHLARLALSELGIDRVPILNHADRSPRWPNGVLGSISHTDGWCGVALTRTGAELVGVGIDAERIHRMSDGVAERVLTQRELAITLASADVTAAAVLRFSAKEAVYKAIFPTVRRFVGFLEVEIELHESGAFGVAAVAPGLAHEIDATRLEGRYVVADGLCFTAVVLR